MAFDLKSEPLRARGSMRSSVPLIRRAAGIFTLLVLAYVVAIAVHSWGDTRTQVTSELTTVAELETRAVNGYFSRLARELKRLGEDVAAAGGLNDLNQSYTPVKKFHEQWPELVNVTLIRPDGAVLLSAKFPPGTSRTTTLANEPSFVSYLAQLKQDGTTLGIGQPLVGLTSKVVIVPVRYGVRDSVGNLAFIVSANLPHEYLRAFWMDAPITGKASIGLIRDNGFLLSRYPNSALASADLPKVYGKPRSGGLMDHLRKTGFPAQGLVTGMSSTDGVEVLTVFRRLPDFPVTLFVAYPTSELRGLWLDRTLITFLATLMLAIAGAASYGYAIRSQLALERDQQRLEEAQAKADAQFELMADSAPVLIWIADTDKLCFWFNKVWLDFTGRTLAQEAGNGWAEGVHADDLQRCLETYLSAFDARQPFSMEYRLRRFDGEYRWLLDNGVPRFDHEGGFAGYIGSCFDITERKAAEQELVDLAASLRRSEARMAASQHLGGTGSWVYDLQTQRIEASTESLRLFGFPETAGTLPLDAFLACVSERERVLQALLASIEARRPYADEYAVQPANGSPQRQIHAIGVLDVDALGHSTQMVGFIQDVTERRAAESEVLRHRSHLEELVAARTAALSIAKESAEAANRAKSTFLATMSHELRTPLNAIMGMTALARGRATDPKQLDQLAKVGTASVQLLGIITDILDISRIEANKLRLNDRELSLDQILRNVESLVRVQADAKHIELVFKPVAERLAIPLRGDAQRLEQIVVNLAGNALKFTDAGSVTVSVYLVRDLGDQVVVRFEVRDTGCGIREDDLPRLFRLFEQIDGSSTRQHGGTGLGLAISKQLVEMMGGQIGVQSQIGVGSTFWFTARLHKAGLHSELPMALSGPSIKRQLQDRHSGCRILVAEDDLINREVAEGVLEVSGLVVHFAQNGATAVEMAGRVNYDLILMDVQMPVMDGLEATRQIRSLPNNPNVPIIAMTANVFPEDEARCRHAGMNDFLARPADPLTFLGMVLKWLDLSAD